MSLPADIAAMSKKLDLLVCAELGLDPSKLTRIAYDDNYGKDRQVKVETFGVEFLTLDRFQELIAEARKPEPGSARARLAEMVAAGQITLCRAGRPVDPSEEEAQMLLDFADQLEQRAAATDPSDGGGGRG